MTELPVDHGQAPRRLHLRLQLGISAQLETLDGRQRVDLIDLSQGGAHLILSQDSGCHEAVLTWLHFETFGTVVWHEGRDICLEFDKPLPLGVLVETRLRAPTVVRDEEEAAAREWATGTSNPAS
jgi:hypothetical protein